MKLRRPARSRRTPYTARGIRRVRCSFAGCRLPGYASWQVCADGRRFRPICHLHDICINRIVLGWMGDRQIETKMRRYEAMVRRRLKELVG